MKKTAKKTVKSNESIRSAMRLAIQIQPEKKLVRSRQSVNAPHVIIQALAGTGKTTTLVGALMYLNQSKQSIVPSAQQQAIWDLIAQEKPSSICFCAFGKAIAEELQSRVPAGVTASTLHSLGNKILRSDMRYKFVKLNDGYKTINDLEAITGSEVKNLLKAGCPVYQIKELVGLCKINLVDPFLPFDLFSVAVDALATHHDIDFDTSKFNVMELVQKCLQAALELDKEKNGKCWMSEIDFNDMIWIPVMEKLRCEKFDLLLVDESQDLNACQQALAMMLGDRLVFCGDVYQAIFGFAGADAESMKTLETTLGNSSRGVQVLPLTETRRCGKAIVNAAKEIVPQYQAHESNGIGRILTVRDSQVISEVRDADMVLCRVNAPLVSLCFRLLKTGRKARIQGRKIGEGLISLIKKLKADSISDLISKLDQWHMAERQKLERKKFCSEGAMIALGDKVDCLNSFIEGAIPLTEGSERTVDDVIRMIEKVFQDSGSGVLLTSIHRAKGLEARRVFFLKPELCPHPMAKLDWQKVQEQNLRYVAITRAIDDLIYVESPAKSDIDLE